MLTFPRRRAIRMGTELFINVLGVVVVVSNREARQKPDTRIARLRRTKGGKKHSKPRDSSSEERKSTEHPGCGDFGLTVRVNARSIKRTDGPMGGGSS